MGSLVNRRRYSSGRKKEERLLPYGYFELKYIENTSDAYIDTGISFNSDLNISCTFRNTDKTKTERDRRVFGGCAGWLTAGISLAENNLVYNNSKKKVTFYNIANKIQFEFINLQYKFSGGLIAQGSFSRTTDGVNPSITLFAENRQNSVLANFIGCIYNFTIEGIINLIPCLSPDNEVGMYDTVTKTFFKSPNGTAFVAGPKVYDGDAKDAPYDYEVEYLESTGTQYIDTGVKPTFDTDIKGRVKWTNVERDVFIIGCRQNSSNTRFWFGTSNAKKYACSIGALTQSTIPAENESYCNFYVNLSETNKCTINDVEFAINTSYTPFNVTYSMYLFGANNIGTFSYGASAKVYNIIIYKHGSPVRNFIPVVKDGVGCMYDKVSGTLFYNQGGGSFIVGPRVIHCTDNDYYGVRWLATDAPDSPIIRIGNMGWHRTLPIQSKMRRCILGDDGSKRYVSDSDYTKDTDGNAIDYTVSSANGVTYDTVVEMPEHCFLTGTETIDDVDYHYIKLFPKFMIGNFVPQHYMGAFEAMLERTSRLYSTVKTNIEYNTDGEVDGADLTYTDDAATYRGGNNDTSYTGAKDLRGRAATYITISRFYAYATARGDGYGIINWAARNNLLRLYLVEYANFNSQADYNPNLTTDGYHQGGLGFGVCTLTDAWQAYNGHNPVMPCGVTLKLGNQTGIVRYNLGATYGSGSSAVTYFDVPSYRGVENPFGHIWENCTGMYIHNVDSMNKIYTAIDGFHSRTIPSTTTDTAPEGYKLRSSNLAQANNWPTSLSWTTDGDFLADSLSSSADKTADNLSILRDYFYGNGSNARKLIVGGMLNGSTRTGLFTVSIHHIVSYISANEGSRLLYVPYYNV